MRETVVYPRHGNAPAGTLQRIQGGWAYGRPRTTMLAPTLATRLAQARSAQFFGLGADAEVATPEVDALPQAPAVVSATVPAEAPKTQKLRQDALRRASGMSATVQAALAAGTLPADVAAKRGEKAAAHAAKLEMAVGVAQNAVAVLQGKLATAKAAGKSTAAHQRVLTKLQARTTGLSRSAARAGATAELLANATGTASGALAGLFGGFGQDDVPATDADAIEEEASVAVADAANAIASDDLPAAELSLDQAAAYAVQADQVRAAAAAAGDLLAQIERSLEPSRIPWRTIGVAAALGALLKALSR